MESKEAIEVLIDKHTSIGTTNCDDVAWRKLQSAVDMAVTALEKQTPKKPNITTGQTDKDKLACCPACDSNVDWTYDGFWRKGKRKYCHECGQAIDWSE